MLWGCFGGESSGDLVQVKGIMKKENYHSTLQRRDSIRFTNYWSKFHSSTGQQSKTFIKIMPKLHPLKKRSKRF
ncbi:hypothetical protein LDENG_00283480 [Lucifuga dentata]|nr:hypothetical protein LDENG_00283480 [Lucifuga dentata]